MSTRNRQPFSLCSVVVRLSPARCLNLLKRYSPSIPPSCSKTPLTFLISRRIFSPARSLTFEDARENFTMARSPMTSIPARAPPASDSPRPSTASLRRRIIILLFLLLGDVVVLSPLLLIPVELAPRLVHPGSSRIHVSPV